MAAKDVKFSSDGRSLYFTSIGWATDSAAHAVDLATRRERYLARHRDPPPIRWTG